MNKKEQVKHVSASERSTISLIFYYNMNSCYYMQKQYWILKKEDLKYGTIFKIDNKVQLKEIGFGYWSIIFSISR